MRGDKRKSENKRKNWNIHPIFKDFKQNPKNLFWYKNNDPYKHKLKICLWCRNKFMAMQTTPDKFNDCCCRSCASLYMHRVKNNYPNMIHNRNRFNQVYNLPFYKNYENIKYDKYNNKFYKINISKRKYHVVFKLKCDQCKCVFFSNSTGYYRRKNNVAGIFCTTNCHSISNIGKTRNLHYSSKYKKIKSTQIKKSWQNKDLAYQYKLGPKIWHNTFHKYAKEKMPNQHDRWKALRSQKIKTPEEKEEFQYLWDILYRKNPQMKSAIKQEVRYILDEMKKPLTSITNLNAK